ncbi:MAG: hypothetical protein IKT98_01625 [Selenomonadaceae bacterium]|nr:hypothetical protein [Selenomonadaceae bacterium]
MSGNEKIDRIALLRLIRNYYGLENGKHIRLIDTSGDLIDVIKKFCSMVGIDYRARDDSFDEYKIDGKWQNILWISSNKAYVLDYFDKKLGIK